MLAFEISPNPTDTRTFIPFLNTIEKKTFSSCLIILPTLAIEEQNYGDVIEKRKRVPLITYNQYQNGKKKKYKNNPFHTANWEYDKEKDVFTCPNGRKLLLSHLLTEPIHYEKRKFDVEPVFGFLKAYLRFTRFSVRGNKKVKKEMGFALLAVNLRK